MKIAIFTDSFFPYLSGATTAIKNRTKGLIRRGHKVAVFRPTANSEIKSELPEELRVYDLPLSISARDFKDLNFEIPLFLPAYSSVKEFDPDVIHVDTEEGVGWQGVFSAKVMRKPLVTTPHTFWADEKYVEYLPLSNKNLKQASVWKYMLYFHGRADVVVPPSQAMKEELKEEGLKKKMEVVPNSIEEVELKSQQFIDQKREQYDLKGEPNLIFVGRVSHEKSLGKALDAYKKICSRFPDSNFGIIGEGDVKERLEKKVERMELTDKVKFLGSIPNDKLISGNLYRLGDIFVAPSKTETFGLVLIEAQSCGLPVIAPAVGGIPEIVTDQKNGSLYSPGGNEVEKLSYLLAELMSNESKREEMSQEALENSERYSIDEVTQKLEKIYQGLIS